MKDKFVFVGVSPRSISAGGRIVKRYMAVPNIFEELEKNLHEYTRLRTCEIIRKSDRSIYRARVVG